MKPTITARLKNLFTPATCKMMQLHVGIHVENSVNSGKAKSYDMLTSEPSLIEGLETIM